MAYELERRLEQIEQSLYTNRQSFTARMVELETKMEDALSDIKGLERKVEKIALGLAALVTALKFGPGVIENAIAIARAAGF